MDIKALKQYIANKSPKKQINEIVDSDGGVIDPSVLKALNFAKKAHDALFAHDLSSANGEKALEQLELSFAALKKHPVLNARDTRYGRKLATHFTAAIKDFDDTLNAQKPQEIKSGLMELRYQIEDIIKLIKHGY